MKKQKGITLIALVITIIILLILAGISISALTNQGIFAQANRAIDEQTKASMKEQIAIYISEATYDYYLNNPEGKTYLEFIAEYLENKEDVLIDIVEQNEDEVILNYTQGKNIVQLLLSSDGTLEIIGSGTTSSGIEDIYAPKVKEKDKTKTSITVTITDASGVLAYAYSLENAKPNADSSIWNQIESPAQTKQITITGLETEKTYYIFAKDTKGNISEGIACTTGEYAKITVVYKESSTATGVLETVNTKENATITLISKPISLNKEGYDFIGWAESEDAEETLDTEYTVPNHNVTLYPVWGIVDGAVVTPINDITTWLKMAGLSKQYSYTTIAQVISDNTCTESLMNNENAMKYLARSTEFADAICANETAMTYLGQSNYVNDTVLNSDIWGDKICDSEYITKVLSPIIPDHTSNTSSVGTVSTNPSSTSINSWGASYAWVSTSDSHATGLQTSHGYWYYTFNNVENMNIKQIQCSHGGYYGYEEQDINIHIVLSDNTDLIVASYHAKNNTVKSKINIGTKSIKQVYVEGTSTAGGGGMCIYNFQIYARIN